MFNRKTFTAALLAVGALCAGTAQAGNVQWSIGINLPAVGTVISNAPVVYAEPQPYYAPPQPVYVQQEPVVVYRSAPVVYEPQPMRPPRYCPPPVVRSGWVVPSYGWHHGRDDWRGERHGHGQDHGPDYRHEVRGDDYGDPSRGGHWDDQPRRQHH